VVYRSRRSRRSRRGRQNSRARGRIRTAEAINLRCCSRRARLRNLIIATEQRVSRRGRGFKYLKVVSLVPALGLVLGTFPTPVVSLFRLRHSCLLGIGRCHRTTALALAASDYQSWLSSVERCFVVDNPYGWTGQQPSSGFCDLAPSILHYNWF
jgi:hypothetical protein